MLSLDLIAFPRKRNNFTSGVALPELKKDIFKYFLLTNLLQI